jgi:hypothetical protein
METKKVKLIDGSTKIIGKFDYFVKVTGKCNHTLNEICENCLLFGSEILNLGGLK